MKGLIVAGALSMAAVAMAAPCGPEALGTSRTLTLPRAAGAWGTAQHAPLPGLAPKEVVLTFDDGPHPQSTPLALQALAAQCVQASFFMNGEPMAHHPDLARRHAGLRCLVQLGRTSLILLFKEYIPVGGIFQLPSHFGYLFLASAIHSLSVCL